MNTFSILRDMLSYWRRPVFNDGRDPLDPGGVLALLGLVAFTVLAMVPLSALTFAILTASGAGVPETSDAFNEMSQAASFVFLAVIIAPLWEELAFRSWMGFRRGLLLVMPGLLLLVCGLLVGGAAPSPAIALPALLIMGFAGYVYFARYREHMNDASVIEATVQRAFPWIFWGTALIFGLIHVSNFESGISPILWPILVGPQIMVALVLGFVRMRFGLLAAIVFHGAYNLVLVTLSSFAPTASETAVMLALY